MASWNVNGWAKPVGTITIAFLFLSCFSSNDVLAKEAVAINEHPTPSADLYTWLEAKGATVRQRRHIIRFTLHIDPIVVFQINSWLQ